MKPLSAAILFCSLLAPAAQAQVDTVRVTSSTAQQKTVLPGEMLPYESVAIYARVNGYVEKVDVDRGSLVKKGQMLANLNAPEIAAQLAEANSKVQVVASQQAEAEARLVAAQSTYQRLKEASQTPGAVAGNELILAEKSVDAARAVVESLVKQRAAAQSAADAIRDLESYLQVKAPFDGVITERLVHPGALVGPGSSAAPLFRLEQNTRLRLVVPVPEADVGGIVRNGRVSFTVPAYPGETFYGTVARVPRSLDSKTRTMPVELDVLNAKGKLAPGMYPEITWPVRRDKASMLVPATAVVTTTERTFVIRVDAGRAEWVDVKKLKASGDLVEVIGDLRAGDEVVKRGSDEIRPGTALHTKPAA